MSPLARPLLALACAALLHAACVQSGPPFCSEDKQGNFNTREVILPTINVSTSLGPVVQYEIPNNCADKQLPLGEIAKVCDWNAVPGVAIYDHLKKVQVTRNAFSYEEPDATLDIRQYCP